MATFKGNSDILQSLGHARALRKVLATKGYQAHVERSCGETRVWVQHPDHKDTVAYAHPENFKAGVFTPYWIAR